MCLFPCISIFEVLDLSTDIPNAFCYLLANVQVKLHFMRIAILVVNRLCGFEFSVLKCSLGIGGLCAV